MSCKLFRQIVRRTYPMLPLAIALWRITTSTQADRIRAQLQFWRLYSRIRFADLLAITIDLIQPEFWS